MGDIKGIKKIDIHAHANAFGKYMPPFKENKPDSYFINPEQLLNFYDQLGIEKGVLLAINAPEGFPAPLPSETCKWVSEQYPDRFYWFCGIDPRVAPIKASGRLSRIIGHYKELGAKGVGEITALMDMDDPQVENLFSACEECEMPVMIHISSSYEDAYGLYDDVGLPRLEKLLRSHPNLKVIGHSQPFWAEISGDITPENRGILSKEKVTEGGAVVHLMREYPNLYCDYSAGSGCNAFTRDEEFTAQFIEEFHERVLYGCDFCFTYNTAPFLLRSTLDRMLDEGKISPEHYKEFVRGNAIKLLKLEEE